MQKGTILTITGSDSTGESGVQADIRAITSLGCTAVSAITSVTIQNTLGIQEFYDLPASVVGGQIEAIVNDVQPQAVKVGMVRREQTLDVVVGTLQKYRPQFVIYDPVLFSTRGDQLMGEEVLRQVRLRLFPLCTAIVVNLRDAHKILGDEAPANVYFIDGQSWHGLANGFSSSLAAYLCQGLDMAVAVEKARQFSQHQLSAATNLQGRGSQLYNDFVHAVQQQHRHNSDVAYYADRLNVSSAYLGQVSRRIAGRSPKAIIDDCIVADIESQLLTTSQSIQQIALELGFSSQAHLSRFFRKLVGQTPSEYRTNKN